MNLGSPLQKNSNLPNQPFIGWLLSQIDVLIGNLLGLVSTGYLVFALIYYSAPKNTEGIGKYLTSNNIQIIIYWIHLIFIFYCVTKLIVILDDNKIGFYRTRITYQKLFKEVPPLITFERSKEVIRKFKVFFICFWVSMFLLYSSFLFHSKWEIKDYSDLQKSPSISTTKQELNAETNSVDLVITERPINEKGDTETKKRSEAFYHIVNEFFIYTMNTISLMFVFWCFSVLYRPPIDDKRLRNQKIMIGISICVTFVLIIIFPLFLQFAIDNNGNYTEKNLKGYVVFFDAISGVLNAVVLALLIARLDSKLVGLPSLLVGILYFYAAVQPLFVVFEQSGFEQNIIKTLVLITVFVLKIYWFFIILYTFQTGRLLNYIVCFPTLNKKVDSIFQNQFEVAIKPKGHDKFSFEITKKNAPIYTTDLKFNNRDECEKEIELLMNLAKDDNSYDIKPKRNGSFIIKILDKNNNDKVLCISTDKTSSEEAEDLKFESMEKLPYCKFDYNKPN